MLFKVIERDGPARIGEAIIDKIEIKTPNILFLNTKRFKSPSFASILITNIKIKSKKPILRFSENLLLQIMQEKNDKFYIVSTNEKIINLNLKENTAKIFIVANTAQLLNQPKKFVDFIINLRKKIGYEKIIYLPSVGEPKNLALLTYLSVDFIDSIKAIIAARNNILLFENGSFKTDELVENPCNCPSCIKINKKPSKMKFQDILSHNEYTINTEIKHIRNAISQENLRNLVENRIKVDPNLTAILRNFDRYHYDFLEKRTPITNKGKIIATTLESLNRPEIKRFQERVINRYKKPKSAKILLLLPCSAKKPYSFSKSHKLAP